MTLTGLLSPRLGRLLRRGGARLGSGHAIVSAFLRAVTAWSAAPPPSYALGSLAAEPQPTYGGYTFTPPLERGRPPGANVGRESSTDGVNRGDPLNLRSAAALTPHSVSQHTQ